MYIDSHTHFDLVLEETPFNEQEIIQSLSDNNIGHAVQISINTDGFEWSNAFSKKYEDRGILFSAGIHPSSPADNDQLDKLEQFLIEYYRNDASNRLFGIGECGLDYYRLHQPKEMQLSSFTKQIELAKQYDLPVIIHSREAMDDTIRLLKENAPLKGIMHCFPGNVLQAKKILDLGLYISFAGNVTFKKAVILHESAQYVPLDRLLIETDAPFLTPVPNRGKKNQPKYITDTYQFIANLRAQNPEKIIDSVYRNFKELRK